MKQLIALLLLLSSAWPLAAQTTTFDDDWRFLLTPKRLYSSYDMSRPDYDDASWRKLSVPHDWSIEGDFRIEHPAGPGGGSLPGGLGWYRKHFEYLPQGAGERLFVEFDGVYMNSTVYINGHELGMRPYGYSSFEYELTPWIKAGENVIAVRVDNINQPNSRWYSGCGIYRHVRLRRTPATRIDHWGLQVTPRKVDAKRWDVEVNVGLDGPASSALACRIQLLDAEGKVVAQQTTSNRAAQKSATLTLRGVPGKPGGPKLWTLSSPYVYTVVAQLLDKGKVVDEQRTTTGLRTLRFDAQTGFWLNDENVKLNGVCNHHDLGCLGTAINEDALYRQLRLLRDMGCNAVRTSHNPPAPELLNMADTMGIMIMDEAFDMWHRRKTQFDYAYAFDEWHERDLRDLVLRDRNHPSIIMWSIGNEVLEQWSSVEADTLTLAEANKVLNMGHSADQLAKEGDMSVNSLLTKHLAEIVKRYDTTRPITAGCNETSPGSHLYRSGAIDVVGFNYHQNEVASVPQRFPGQPMVMTESVSAIQTRGFYMMPSDHFYTNPDQPDGLYYHNASLKCSAYDNMHVTWGSSHEATWDVVKHTPHCMGQFIWTGFDYLGEPTPYNYPARSSYFGIIDLAGHPKDSYYMYQSEWTEKPMLHLFPHWNWMPSDTIDLWCYYRGADEVELFVNGCSAGVRRKADREYHVWWRVAYEPGEVTAVARKDGKEMMRQTIRTASTPHHLRLTDEAGTHCGTHFVTVEVVDRDGNLCPWADDDVFFSTTGEARIQGVDNGCQTSPERFQANQRKAFFGKCLVVLKGNGTLTCRGYNLETTSITLSSPTLPAASRR